MRSVRRRWLCSCALALSCFGACSKSEAGAHDDAGPSDGGTVTGAAQSSVKRPDVCGAICEQSAPLKCVAFADCLRDCRVTRDALAGCSSLIDAFFACQLRQPLDRIECQEDGMPTVKEPECASEREAMATCIARVGGADGL